MHFGNNPLEFEKSDTSRRTMPKGGKTGRFWASAKPLKLCKKSALRRRLGKVTKNPLVPDDHLSEHRLNGWRLDKGLVMHRKSLLIHGSAVLLSACGGGSGVGTVGNSSYDALVATGEAHADKLDTPLSVTTTLPSGTANFSGVAVVADDFDTSSQGAIGAATLSVNFDTQAVSGSATGFFQTDIDTAGNAVPGTSAPVSGSLSFSASSIAAASTFPLDVDGTVNFAGAAQTIDGVADAAFFGTGADMLVGFGTDLLVTSGTISNADIAIIAD